jgi:hypothetical protein
MDPARVAQLGRIAGGLASPFADRAEVLRHHGLDEDRWHEAKSALGAALAGDPALRDVFRRAFESPTSVPSSGPRSGLVGVALAAAAPSVPQGPPSAPEAAPAPLLPVDSAAPKFVPSYLRQPRVEAAPPPLQGPVLPAHALAPATGTEDMDMSFFRAPAATPFAATPPQVTPARRDAQIASDHILAARARGSVDVALPAGDCDETVLGAPLGAGRSLPFDKRTRYAPTSSPAGPATPFQPTAGDAARPPPAAQPVVASSMSGRTVAATSLKRQSLPFRKSSGPSAPPPVAGWDVVRYGRLCIDLVRGGKEEDVVLANHGITRDQRRALDRYWEERMLGEPEQRLEWKRACDARVEELSRGR